MKKASILLLLLMKSLALFSQEIDIRELTTYNNVKDSLLVTLWHQIKEDVGQRGYQLKKLTPDDINFEGHIMILEVFITPNISYIIGLFGVSDSMYEKFKKQTAGFRFRRQMYVGSFRKYIEEYKELPYLDKVTYKFIALYQDGPPDHSIFGEYLFRMNENKHLEIEKGNIEILRNENEFMSKYNSNF